ncbi:SPOR domain-containing protein [Paenibacillus roseipurpureus]|uniref:SPOR domain-containing protein n=1 Tax=Paenibacillus roseopurpureus TaxID=2918901 RepID=A0AA96LTQ3_9BACL|nr:SPOR domain-containing protein [Paenibacillus sp. MBLB1832]WNR45838.1 SPOR domain-containing protein [Paenibacillus sp. MBLB1832]
MKKARITYRFDPKEGTESSRRAARVHDQEENVIPLYQEEFKVIDSKTERNGREITPFDQSEREQVESLFESHALNTFTTDFGNWNSSFETEGERVERIIRDSQSVREQQVDTQPPQIQPPAQPIEKPDEWSNWTPKDPYREIDSVPRIAKSSSTPWFRIATSVAGAVVTGIAFGFFVLSMFSTDRDTNVDAGATAAPNKITVSSANSQASSSTKTQTGTNNAALPASAAVVTAVQIPAKSYTFLQNGVFSSLQGAQAVQDSLGKKGLAAAMDTSDKLTVFVGFAKTRDDATALRQKVQESDKTIEVFMKNVDFPAVTGIRWSGTKPESVPTFIAEGDKLVNSISGLTLVHLAETKPTALTDASMQAIRTSHQTMITLSTTLADGAGDDVRASLQKMTTAMNRAVQSMEEYKKTPSTSLMWQAQSAMMQYIIAQKEFLKGITVA